MRFSLRFNNDLTLPAYTSRAGRTTLKGSVYGATKWFIHGWANNLHEEMREWGGRCTVICPGMVGTPGQARVHAGALRHSARLQRCRAW